MAGLDSLRPANDRRGGRDLRLPRLRTWMTGSGPDMCALGLLALVGGLFLWELVLLVGVPFARDVQVFFLPQRHILAEALREGRLPLWTPLLGTGSPFLANFQSGVFYPIHWAYAVLPLLAAFDWLLVFHFLLGGVAFYLLCREVDFNPPVAWVAAAAWMLGGYFVSLTNLVNVQQTAAWAPLLPWALLRFQRRPGTVGFVIIVAVHALGFLAGGPQTFLMAAGAGLVFALVRATYESDARSRALTSLFGLAAAAAIVAGLTAVQVLPTLDMVAHSTRGVGLEAGEAMEYSLAPIRLLHLVLPNQFADPVYRFGTTLQLRARQPWLYSTYLGVVTLALAWPAWRDRSRRREVLFWAAAGGLGLLLALGRHLPLYGALFHHLPGFEAFRYPEKFFLFTALSVPMLAAHGLSVLRRRQTGRADLIAAIVGLMVAAAGCVAWVWARPTIEGWAREHLAGLPILEHPDFAYATFGGVLIRLALLLALTMLVIWLHRRRRVGRVTFTALAGLLVVGDFWAAHRQLVPVVDPELYVEPPAVLRHLPREGLSTTWRYQAATFGDYVGSQPTFAGLARVSEKWYWHQTMQPSTGALYDVLTLDSGDAIHLLDTVKLTDLLRVLDEERRWRLLRLGSVRYVYSARHHPPDVYLDRFRVDSLPGHLYVVKDPLPRAYLARGVTFDDQLSALNAAMQPGFDIESTAAIVRGAGEQSSSGATEAMLRSAPGTDSAPSSPGPAEIIFDGGEEVRVAVNPAISAYLILTDKLYPGWRAYVDGEERRIRAANYFFRAVPVRPGDREVVFRYSPAHFKTGAKISLASLLLFVTGIGVSAIRRRRRRTWKSNVGSETERSTAANGIEAVG